MSKLKKNGFSAEFTFKFMQPLCLVQGTTSCFDVDSVSQWNETGSACELLASQVSVLFLPRTLRDGGWGC